MQTIKAAIAANRFGLGAGLGDARSVGSDPAAWLDAQLSAAAKSVPQNTRPFASAETLKKVSTLRLARRQQRARGAKNRGQNRTEAVDGDTIREFARFVGGRYRDQVSRRFRSSIESEQPFVERLVYFWANHFAISADKQPIGTIAVDYENEAIRPHVSGRFLDMLIAVEQHPAMILFLDNQQSMGPNSLAARAVRRNRGRELGLNENLAREILELHTLGVDGGYDQQDVTEFAKVLTGWSIGGGEGRRAGGEPGEFYFRAFAHEPGAKQILGKRYPERGIDEAHEVLADLARHPSTAHYLATKLVRHFVADEPPAGMVDALARAYLDADGELLPVYRALIEADASWQEPLSKYKTPQDFLISAYRALDHTPKNLQQVIAVLTQLGQRPLTPGSPAGWPDTAQHWNGGNALLKRIEWATAVGRNVGDRIDSSRLADAILGPVLSKDTVAAIGNAESGAQGMAILLSSPEFQRR